MAKFNKLYGLMKYWTKNAPDCLRKMPVQPVKSPLILPRRMTYTEKQI